MSDIDELRRCHLAWQNARQQFFERLDQTLAGAPMDWELMTSAVSSIDKCIREFMAAAERARS